jgi:hypothetical protein
VLRPSAACARHASFPVPGSPFLQLPRPFGQALSLNPIVLRPPAACARHYAAFPSSRSRVMLSSRCATASLPFATYHAPANSPNYSLLRSEPATILLRLYHRFSPDSSPTLPPTLSRLISDSATDSLPTLLRLYHRFSPDSSPILHRLSRDSVPLITNTYPLGLDRPSKIFRFMVYQKGPFEGRYDTTRGPPQGGLPSFRALSSEVRLARGMLIEGRGNACLW